MKRVLLALLAICMLPLTVGVADLHAQEGTRQPTLVPPAHEFPTPAPMDWVSVGDVGFDAASLGQEECASLIRQLQRIQARAAIRDSQIVDGRETTRLNPCWRGQSAEFERAAYNDDYTAYKAKVTMTLSEVIRGEEAIAAADVDILMDDAEEIADDTEYVLCTFSFTVEMAEDISVPKNVYLPFATHDFQGVTEQGQPTHPMYLGTNEKSVVYIYIPTGSGLVQVLLCVDKGSQPLVMYQIPGETGTVWFSTQNQ